MEKLNPNVESPLIALNTISIAVKMQTKLFKFDCKIWLYHFPLIQPIIKIHNVVIVGLDVVGLWWKCTLYHYYVSYICRSKG